MINIFRYNNREEVKLGDRVEVRSFFFFKDLGKVVYIPSISKFHPEMENNGIQYIGIKLDGKSFAAATIDPKSNVVINTKLLGRGLHNINDDLKDNEGIFESEN